MYLIDLVKGWLENDGFQTGGSYWNELFKSWINIIFDTHTVIIFKFQ